LPLNSFSIGRDVTLTIVSNVGPLNLNLITGFQSKQDTIEQKVKGLDGVTRFLRFFDAWSGTFTLERQDSTLDDYFSQLEANYYQGLTEFPVSITETIQENSGALSQYRYMNVMLKYDDAGEFRGDQTVKQSLSFVAHRRVKIA
jgi:hypothetical protein